MCRWTGDSIWVSSSISLLNVTIAYHLSTTQDRWRNPVKCLSQEHNKQTCWLCLHTIIYAEHQTGCCDNQQSSVWPMTQTEIELHVYRFGGEHFTNRPTNCFSVMTNIKSEKSKLGVSGNIFRCSVIKFTPNSGTRANTNRQSGTRP